MCVCVCVCVCVRVRAHSHMYKDKEFVQTVMEAGKSLGWVAGDTGEQAGDSGGPIM